MSLCLDPLQATNDFKSQWQKFVNIFKFTLQWIFFIERTISFNRIIVYKSFQSKISYFVIKINGYGAQHELVSFFFFLLFRKFQILRRPLSKRLKMNCSGFVIPKIYARLWVLSCWRTKRPFINSSFFFLFFIVHYELMSEQTKEPWIIFICRNWICSVNL